MHGKDAVSARRLCLIPDVRGVGGMVSFKRKIVAAAGSRGIELCFDLHDPHYDAVLVMGGTRRLGALWAVRRRGVPIVQRLDGMNWLHRRLHTGLRHYLRAEWSNWILAFIRKRLAARIVYQSHFAKSWWEREHGTVEAPGFVVHNGVDLERYSPYGDHDRPQGRIRILLVEGRLGGGYEIGLEHALRFADRLAPRLAKPLEMVVAGAASPAVKASAEARAGVPITWAGLVPHERIAELDRSAHLLYAADLNAACPNAVIEAMACGLPVVAFDTGALAELVGESAGRLAPYGGDVWRLDPPDFEGLAEAGAAVLAHWERYHQGARDRAQASLGLDQMIEGYFRALGWQE